jgi:hypothetical protein
MTPSEFAPIWLDMLRACPSAKPIEGTSSLYARKLAPFTAAEVEAAVDVLILEREWVPPIAAIWQRCVDARDQAPGWEEAWTEAQEHAGTREAYPWSHEVAQQAARTIGLYEIRASTNPAATRAQFRDAYLSILERRRRQFAASERELPPPARRAIEATKGA